MTFDSVDHIGCYRDLHPDIYRGLALLTSDFSGLADDRYPVNGDRLFYMIQSYETRPDNGLPEAHPEKDLYLYRGPTDRVTLTPGSCHKVVVKVRID